MPCTPSWLLIARYLRQALNGDESIAELKVQALRSSSPDFHEGMPCTE